MDPINFTLELYGCTKTDLYTNVRSRLSPWNHETVENVYKELRWTDMHGQMPLTAWVVRDIKQEYFLSALQDYNFVYVLNCSIPRFGFFNLALGALYDVVRRWEIL